MRVPQADRSKARRGELTKELLRDLAGQRQPSQRCIVGGISKRVDSAGKENRRFLRYVYSSRLIKSVPGRFPTIFVQRDESNNALFIISPKQRVREMSQRYMLPSAPLSDASA